MTRIRQNLSSDSLFHFIKRREWLLEILINKQFQARYVYENISEIDLKIGIPMKCFCDIPLGVIKKHINNYGKYGIGISKEFAKRKTFSPVIYFHNNSDTLIRYLRSIKYDGIVPNDSLLPYFKIDERRTSLKGGKVKIERFYDEREWRFIPIEPFFIDLSDYDEEGKWKMRLDSENHNLINTPERYSLPFEYKDIKYIFVQEEDDIDKVIEQIKKIGIESIEQDRLIAKIITSNQIEKDFLC